MFARLAGILFLFSLTLSLSMPALAKAQPSSGAEETPIAAAGSSIEAAEGDRTSVLPGHRVSVTVNPLLLIFGYLEVMGEFRLHDQVGVAAMVAGGPASTWPQSTASGFLAHLGVQGNYYVFRDFDHGLHVGAKALGHYLDIEDALGSLSRFALIMGGYGGYKFAASSGLTVVAQVGGVLLFDFERTSLEEGQAGFAGTRQAPYMRLHLGWSF